MGETKQPGRLDRPRIKKVAFITCAALLGALALLLAANWHRAQHRRLYVVNGYDQPLTVTIPGAGSAVFSGPGRKVLAVAEGDHSAAVAGATNQSIPFALHSGFWGRFFDRTVFVLNPGGAALLVIEETIYAGRENPVDPSEAGGYQLYFGRPFMAVPDVDYVFEEFPEQITIKHASGREHRRRLDQVLQDPLLTYYSLVGQAKYLEALNLAEWQLTLRPDRTEILSAYVGVAQVAGAEARAKAFLALGAAHRPIQIEWHRMYQEVRAGEPSVLTAEYDALLAEYPDSSAACYLRGRLAGACSEAVPYYVRAAALDPTSGFAHFALGMCQATQGQWEAARQSLAQAVQVQPGMARFKAALFDARMALHEFEALETELRSALAANPVDYMANVQLIDVHLARGQAEMADLLVKNYEMQSRDFSSQNLVELIPTLKARAWYSAGRFEDLLRLAAQHPGQINASLRFEALIELARFDEAFKLFPMDDPRLNDPIQHLSVSLALKQAGQNAQAQAWMTNALDRLARGRAEFRLAHALATRPSAPTLGEVRDVSLTPSAKAVLLAVLAGTFPERRAEFFQEARILNVSREYPFHLIQRVTNP